MTHGYPKLPLSLSQYAERVGERGTLIAQKGMMGLTCQGQGAGCLQQTAWDPSPLESPAVTPQHYTALDWPKQQSVPVHELSNLFFQLFVSYMISTSVKVYYCYNWRLLNGVLQLFILMGTHAPCLY